ncbi:hypothetical protein SGRIM128S_00017 [Streptomyces griseomycini]
MIRSHSASALAKPAKEASAAPGSAATASTMPFTCGFSERAKRGWASSSLPDTTATAFTRPCAARARANGAPCENPTADGARRARSRTRCRMSVAQLVRVRPGAGSEAPRPGRSALMSRTPAASTTPPPKASHLLVAAPGHSSTGVPSAGPHSAQPRSRPSGSRVCPSRAGSRMP